MAKEKTDAELDALEPGGMRKLLKEQAAANADLEAKLQGYIAKDTVAELGLRFVKPEDLVGVAQEDIQERARAIEAERLGPIRSTFEAQGFSGDVLEAKITEFLTPGTESGKTENQDLSGFSTAASVTSIAGTPPKIDTANMTPAQKIVAGL